SPGQTASAGGEVRAPTLGEVLGGCESERCIAGSTAADERWHFFATANALGSATQLAYRCRLMLANLLLLHRTLHAGKRQDRQLEELRRSVKAYSKPAEEESL